MPALRVTGEGGLKSALRYLAAQKLELTGVRIA
ncbi:hypothetical protein BN1180_05835 [Peribacillus simplex]|uniref:Uncharacterized protein n=1 Tax=Peribacillus simplex TaxID=1478 RepID=A0AAN2TQ74_9BACI|nr:hypothetical protein BN1180_05835 [Peribacillus simplex]CRH69645.1 Uncharacterised protein [Chlamydia trachomatis]